MGGANSQLSMFPGEVQRGSKYHAALEPGFVPTPFWGILTGKYLPGRQLGGSLGPWCMDPAHSTLSRNISGLIGLCPSLMLPTASCLENARVQGAPPPGHGTLARVWVSLPHEASHHLPLMVQSLDTEHLCTGKGDGRMWGGPKRSQQAAGGLSLIPTGVS